MNYFKLQKKINDFYSQNSCFNETPLLKKLITAHLERSFFLIEQGEQDIPWNMGLVNFSKYISWKNPEYIIRKVLFFLRRKSKLAQTRKQVTVLSPSMFKRFPDLIPQIKERRDIVCLLTAFNHRVVPTDSSIATIKIHDIIYPKEIIKPLNDLFTIINKRLLNTHVSTNIQQPHLEALEYRLSNIVLKLVKHLRATSASNYISAFSNRYDDILIGLACKRLEIPSKEISHGMNNLTLENGQTLVPNFLDYLYVWREQAAKTIENYGGSKDRIRVLGYPKYSQERTIELSAKYPEKKRVTFFSQPIYYTMGGPTQPISDFQLTIEKDYRRKLLSLLSKISIETNYEINIRYHQSELYKPTYSRNEEISYIKNHTNINISKRSFNEDLFESEICIGVNTSCLYESFVVGKKTIQLAWPDNKQGYHECIPIISIEKLHENLLKTMQEDSSPVRSHLLANLNLLLDD